MVRDKRPCERIIVSEQSQIRLDGKCVGAAQSPSSPCHTQSGWPVSRLHNPKFGEVLDASALLATHLLT